MDHHSDSMIVSQKTPLVERAKRLKPRACWEKPLVSIALSEAFQVEDRHKDERTKGPKAFALLVEELEGFVHGSVPASQNF